MENINYCGNTRIVMNDHAEMQIADFCVQYGYKKVLFVHDEYGAPEQTRNEMVRLLKDAGIDVFIINGIVSSPNLGKVNEGISIAKENGIAATIGLGGGSVIDTAKTIAAGALYDGDVWDFFAGKEKLTKALPIIAIPTCPGTGSETGNAAVMTNEEISSKIGLNADPFRPVLALINPILSYTYPVKLTASGLCDAFSHAAENYFNPSTEFNFIDECLEANFRRILEITPEVLKHPDSYELRAESYLLANAANNGILGIGHKQEWASHRIVHPLSSIYHGNHGVTLTVILPAWMKYVYKNNIIRFKRFAINVFSVDPLNKTDEEICLEGIRSVENFYKSVGMPVSFKEAGFPTDQFKELAKMVYEETNNSFGNIMKLNEEDVYNIYKLAE